VPVIVTPAANYESIYKLDPLDNSNTVQLVADIISKTEPDSPFSGVVEVECFDDKLYFNARQRGLWRYDPGTSDLVKLLDISEVGSSPEHTTGSDQHVSSIKSLGDMLIVSTESDLLVTYDGLNFDSILSPGQDSFKSIGVEDKPKILGNDVVGYYFIYNLPGGI
jgi:hypothetical protein